MKTSLKVNEYDSSINRFLLLLDGLLQISENAGPHLYVKVTKGG